VKLLKNLGLSFKMVMHKTTERHITVRRGGCCSMTEQKQEWGEKDLFAIYDCAEKRFHCSAALQEMIDTAGDGQIFLKVMEGYGDSAQKEQRLMENILTREAFLDSLETVFARKGRVGGGVVYFDVQRFKVINSMFGMSEGDRLLQHIADQLCVVVGQDGFACHFSADRFVFYIQGDKAEIERRVKHLFENISAFELPFDILCNAGVYLVTEETVDANMAVDFAIIAQSAVKGSFTESVHFYNEELRISLLGEQEITGMMRNALKTQQYVVYYQPQYNHSTGMLVGAEALVRWLHPEKGLIPPAQFIPVFENNGFISHLDQYVFEKVCAFLRRQIDENIRPVPVSVNLTRYDLFVPGYLDTLEDIRRKYDVPPKYIRIEITESSALGNSHFINEAMKVLHEYGYTVEMDDFGSGYSSLNILKDIDVDIIKLDMRFFEGEGESGRGGIILSSVIRMVNWLQLPMIAEGVETVEQADFLRSVGCDYIQGYLYAKPLPGAEFEKLLRDSQSHVGRTSPHMTLIETMDADHFWSSESLETLIFSKYVGSAGIFDYIDGRAEVLRVNKKYLQELGMNLSEKDVINKDILSFLDEPNRKIFINMLEKAIETGEEEECETWRTISSSCCGEERICIRTTARTIGRAKGNYIFYAMIRNITAEKKSFTDILNSERRFMAASEQINIYCWEYTVATREMRPCFRCMRDLGLPALLTNYPDSAIEMGIFPPEVADMYRDWHRQIAEGVPSLEAVIPLTVGRVPFHVRYTTEFDEGGHPVKAYGSAALVVDA